MKITNYFVRYVDEAEMIPRWWGCSHRAWHRRQATIMPIPLNWIVGMARWAYFTLVRAPESWNDYVGWRRTQALARSATTASLSAETWAKHIVRAMRWKTRARKIRLLAIAFQTAIDDAKEEQHEQQQA